MVVLVLVLVLVVVVAAVGSAVAAAVFWRLRSQTLLHTNHDLWLV